MPPSPTVPLLQLDVLERIQALKKRADPGGTDYLVVGLLVVVAVLVIPVSRWRRRCAERRRAEKQRLRDEERRRRLKARAGRSLSGRRIYLHAGPAAEAAKEKEKTPPPPKAGTTAVILGSQAAPASVLVAGVHGDAITLEAELPVLGLEPEVWLAQESPDGDCRLHPARLEVPESPGPVRHVNGTLDPARPVVQLDEDALHLVRAEGMLLPEQETGGSHGPPRTPLPVTLSALGLRRATLRGAALPRRLRGGRLSCQLQEEDEPLDLLVVDGASGQDLEGQDALEVAFRPATPEARWRIAHHLARILVDEAQAQDGPEAAAAPGAAIRDERR